jgi:hypothetical protein
VEDGARVGLLAGFGIAAMAACSHYGFLRIAWRVYLVDMGYTVLGTVLMGMVLAKWKS